EDFDAGGPGQDQPDSGYSGAAYRRLSRHADGDAGRVPGGHRDGGRGGGRLFPADRGHLPSGGEG
ncbi:IS66 family transposase, partial [Dysosmobacter welbionis]